MALAAAAASETISGLLVTQIVTVPKIGIAAGRPAVLGHAFPAGEKSSGANAYETAGSPLTKDESPVTSISASQVGRAVSTARASPSALGLPNDDAATKVAATTNGPTSLLKNDCLVPVMSGKVDGHYAQNLALGATSRVAVRTTGQEMSVLLMRYVRAAPTVIVKIGRTSGAMSYCWSPSSLRWPTGESWS